MDYLVVRENSTTPSSSSGGAIAREDHTGAGGFRDELGMLVGDGAFDVGGGFSSLDDVCIGGEFGSPHWAEKINF